MKLFWIGLFIGLIAGNLIGFVIAVNAQRYIAVKKGHAEYYLDDNYDRRWRWKTAQ